MTTQSEWVCCCGAELNGSHDHNSCGPPEPRSTPITPEGLRGLGLTGHMARHRVEVGPVAIDVWASGLVIVSPAAIGYAPDLETVGRLIEVLRRMNGGG